MSDTIELWELCQHGRCQAHPIDKLPGSAGPTALCPGGKKIVMRQLYEPQESHREPDNELVATWGFGAGADAEIPPMWVEVSDE